MGFTSSLMDVIRGRLGGRSPFDYFDLDVASVGPKGPPATPDHSRWFEGRALRPGTQINAWGVAHEPGSMYHFTHYVSPLAGRPGADLKHYELLDRVHPSCFEGMAQRVAEWRDKGYATSGMVGHTYETAWQIRGYDDFLRDMVLDPGPIEDLVEAISRQNEVIARRLAEAGVDVLRLGDDVANQNALMFSPALWRRFFKGRMRRVIAAAREVKPDIHVWYHSDGNVEAIIPELMEAGVTILNPVQPECMDLRRIRALYGDRLCFWGCIGTQSTMPWGTPDEVRRVTRETIDLMGPGLLVAPTHVLEPEVPWDNIVALAEMVREYRYR
jgi:uroporphyrinogen decarboxylase